jgi:hypothetical protein
LIAGKTDRQEAKILLWAASSRGVDLMLKRRILGRASIKL